MFETLFSRQFAVKRHRSAPLVDERIAYLQCLANQRIPSSTIKRSAFICRWISYRIQKWPQEYKFYEKDIEALAISWARRRSTNRRRFVPKPSPKENFKSVVRSFLHSIDRLVSPVKPPPVPYEDRLQDFLSVQSQQRGLSKNTCRFRCKQVRRFLTYLNEQNCTLKDVSPVTLDTYIQDASKTWCRVSLSSVAVALRAWLRYCESKNYVKPGISAAIFLLHLFP